MLLSREEAIGAAAKLAPIATRLFPGSSVYLFGSYAKGKAKPSSDIDVAIIVPNSDDYDSVDYNKRIGELNLAAYDVNDKIEAIVRESQDCTGFVDIIRSTGIKVA